MPHSSYRVPDETTIWRFRGALTVVGATDWLFARFDAHLRDQDFLAPFSDCSAIACWAMVGGRIVDASIIAAPRQRMTDAECGTVAGGGTLDGWKDRPATRCEKDRDARWTGRTWPSARRSTRGRSMRQASPTSPKASAASPGGKARVSPPEPRSLRENPHPRRERRPKDCRQARWPAPVEWCG